ncbi:hypothetical protein BG006_010757 [Podila minutissima]|uniref:DUF3020 domain-containing protein n=1 Tax=Podila minutissima TaxID=64525 RepID=A0A9P5SDC2_9FUNG|nr:hypothetical protein BG006_010757 [Podila minutissima]
MIRDETFQAQTVAALQDPLQESLKRDLVTLKVRTENHKDNDLRCRVNKRANKLFGKVESEHKARWIEEEFGKRQQKRKEKERRRTGGPSESVEPSPAPSQKPAISEHLLLHQQQLQQQQQQLQQQQQHQLQASQLLGLGSQPQFDAASVKTALALNDLVKKSHLDLAQLTEVLTDPNLARQLIEIEANHPAPQPLMVINTVKEAEVKDSHTIDADYPMDAVLTLMQLNGSWKA